MHRVHLCGPHLYGPPFTCVGPFRFRVALLGPFTIPFGALTPVTPIEGFEVVCVGSVGGVGMARAT